MTNYRIIPDFSSYAIHPDGSITNINTGKLKQPSYSPKGSLRVSVTRDCGAKTTLTIESALRKAGFPVPPGLETFRKPPGKSIDSPTVHMTLDQRIAHSAQALERANAVRRDRDEWHAICAEDTAAKRDAAFARAGRPESVPASVLERELRCLRGSRLMLVRPATETGLSASCLYDIV